MSKWNIIKLAGKDFLLKSSIKKPLRFPIDYKRKSFARKGKPRKKWGIKIYDTVKGAGTKTKPKPSFEPRRTNRFARTKRIYHRKRMTGIEFSHLKGLAKKFGIERDLFDFKAHIDTSISYEENKAIIEKKIRNIAPIKKEFHIKSSEATGRVFDTRKFLGVLGVQKLLKEHPTGMSLKEFKSYDMKEQDIEEATKTGLIFRSHPNRFRSV